MNELITHEIVLAKDVMSRPVRKLTYETLVPDAAAFLLRHGISGAPIIGSHGRPVGVFTLHDLARAVQTRLLPHASSDRTLEKREPPPKRAEPPLEGLEKSPVGTLMTPGLFTVFPESTLDEIVRSMASQKIHRLFVISEKGDLEGVITSMDVLKWIDRKYLGQKEKDRAEHRA